MKYAIFVFDADGDMGYGTFYGPFASAARADKRAAELRSLAPMRADLNLEILVVPVVGGSAWPIDVINRDF